MSETPVPRVLFLSLCNIDDATENLLKKYHVHLYCHGGRLDFIFNDESMSCNSGQFLFWFAESRWDVVEVSGDFKATVLLVEKNFLIDNVPDQGWSINAQLHSRVHPVKDINTEAEKEKILNNFNWLLLRFQETDHRFYEEALKLQMRLFILEMWHSFANEYERRRHSLQTGTLYEQFINLLQQHCLTKREVQFYANELNITPKYLNHLCKIHSDRTASDWIHSHAKERIILLLQNRHLNIAEIAEEMQFSSTSFFTRYVKKLLGQTPTDFRTRLEIGYQGG
ncbi:helix-turn-helix domain-containing protein [Pedobacter sp. D749]|uniref:helix-turn-helix domain-containing protein n=1 Tax=Pedobacter sp. D749 TaxID=2856523 RepID=UPI001C568B4F|nr:helix-turn-helix domain-containing protein [Pedobacter sp. D749]QXU42129.1 helix-turn-helix domain-containing protein [Pedobacter sp. D749]